MGSEGWLTQSAKGHLEAKLRRSLHPAESFVDEVGYHSVRPEGRKLIVFSLVSSPHGGKASSHH